MYLLDTNHVGRFLAGQNDSLRSKMQETPWSEMALPFIVAGELLYGAYYSSVNYREKNVQAATAFIEKITVIFPTVKSHHIYGEHKARLRKEGKLVPDNDLWIASLALERNAILVSNDTDFGRIKGLKIENWLE